VNDGTSKEWKCLTNLKSVKENNRTLKGKKPNLNREEVHKGKQNELRPTEVSVQRLRQWWR
jgi:hypothetical protein